MHLQPERAISLHHKLAVQLIDLLRLIDETVHLAGAAGGGRNA